MLKIVIATRNAGKLKEISEKLKDYPVVLVSLLDYPQIPEIEEKGTTFSENAFLNIIEALLVCQEDVTRSIVSI